MTGSVDEAGISQEIGFEVLIVNRAIGLRSLDLRPVGPLDQVAHLRLGHRLTLRCPEVQVQKQRPQGQDSPSAASLSTVDGAAGPTLPGRPVPGAASNASRIHSARRNPAPRARSSIKASSASETFVPTDFVRRDGFSEHRPKLIFGEIWGKRPHDACVSLGRPAGGRTRA